MKRYFLYALSVLISLIVLPFSIIPFYLHKENTGNEISTYIEEEQTENSINTEEEQTEKSLANEEQTININSVMVQALVTLNVREKPTVSSQILGTLSQFESVNYIQTVDNWFQIYYNQQLAYVSSYFEYSRVFDCEDNTLTEDIISCGMSLLGTPYEYGSQRLLNYNGTLNYNFTGDTYDCSAFIQYIFYTGANIALYGDSRSMSVQGETVNYNEIQRGDVIFMTSTSRLNNVGIERIGHVCIYLGDNMIMHTFGTGGVRIQIFSEFWRGRFITAKRMI